MKCALIGEKLGHSYSKLIHEAFGLYSYELVSLPRDRVGEFMENGDFDAFNVTIPYKRTVIPYCSYISPEAQKIGSVNTVIRTQDGLHGFNTDYFGFKSMAARAGIDFAGKKVVILGSGGTSLTARAVAADCGADRITVVSRSGEYNYENLEKLSDCEVLINTTPVGMYPNNGCSAVKLDSFPRREAVLDVIYNPLRTELIMQALERGISCSGGLYMLVAQAAQSAKYFCSAEIGEKEIERVFRSLALDVQNIVLVGMPGCGKTTVAAALEGLTGRKSVDTDSLVEEAAGMSVPDIFSEYGEAHFRELEAQAIRGIAKEKADNRNWRRCGAEPRKCPSPQGQRAHILSEKSAQTALARRQTALKEPRGSRADVRDPRPDIFKLRERGDPQRFFPRVGCKKNSGRHGGIGYMKRRTPPTECKIFGL